LTSLAALLSRHVVPVSSIWLRVSVLWFAPLA